jgi:hypothetical protein
LDDSRKGFFGHLIPVPDILKYSFQEAASFYLIYLKACA